MEKILNQIFNFLKYLLFIAAFGSCLYIMLNMNQRLSKPISESISVFVPYFILLILFLINILRRQKAVNHNLFFNITCCLIFTLMLFVAYRAFGDSYLLVKASFTSGINFNYYADMISPFKVMIYGLAIADLLLILSNKREVATQIDLEKLERPAFKKKR